jgi:valyl-tRNA synthetase
MMGKVREIEKNYNPKAFEDRIYEEWLENGYFKGVVDSEKEPFTIMMPPPNITGQLHMGHALDNSLQDIFTRYKRMKGFSALWVPGTDHAAIATELKIVEALEKEGIKKGDLTREQFLEKAWEWKDHYGGRIVEQLKKLGSSCDWERERFTMDEGLSDAVLEVFVDLYKKGLIYRGERIVNWCPKCKTSISDAEVDFEEKEGHMWHMRYPLKDGEGFIVIATTRPETMLGDTAVAVHPEDPRYKDLIGKNLILPLVNREIPIVADNYVEKDFGTGAVKITPAHDPNDFEVGLRHHLPIIQVMDDQAIMNQNAGAYKGLDRYEARKKIVEDLTALGLLEKIQPHTHNVGQCYRCSNTIEPAVKIQWFVKMKPLADPAIEVVKNGTIKMIPERFTKVYYNWMENIKDWCISRQLWWGHRIPAFYCQDCHHINVAKSTPEKCEKCGGNHFVQDEDTLDTWFSSALWPYSTLGWPEKTPEMDYFFPTNLMVTGYDLVFFWVARMIFSSLENTGKRPFETVLFHGIVRDENGKKMSKSLGNGIDPLEIIDKYGADALRFALIIGTTPGNDLRFSEEKIESSRNFANKIWNASRFVLMNFDENPDFTQVHQDKFTMADKWILSKLNNVAKEVNQNIDKFEYGQALQKIYDFIWEEFCDWYIEMVKSRLYDQENPTRLEALYVLNHVLGSSMKLLHPFMPFITEEIYSYLHHEDPSIMLAKYPEYTSENEFSKEEWGINAVKNAIKAIRNVRTEMNVPMSKKANIVIVTQSKELKEVFEESVKYFERLAGAEGLKVQDHKQGIDKDWASSVMEGAEIFIPLKELIDFEKELQRLQKEKENLEEELTRSEKKLNNKGFMAKAPESLVSEEREKAKKYQDMYDKVIERISALKG